MDAAAADEARLQEGVTWMSLLNTENRRALIIGVGMLMYSCFSGINVVIFYSTSIFGFAGVHNALLSTVLVFGLNVIMTIVVTFTVDKAGRVVFLLGGSGTMVVALCGLGAVLLGMPAGTAQGWLAVSCVLLYVAGFAVSFGGVGFTLLSEVVPTAIRPKAFTVALTGNFIGNLALSLSVLNIIDAVGGGSSDEAHKRGVAILFLFFAGVVVTAFLFIWFYIPETKGRSMQEIARLMGTDAAPQGAEARRSSDERAANVVDSPGARSVPDYRDAEKAPLVHRTKTSGS
jgi:MFS family permease